MPRDYKHRAQKRPPKKPLPAWLWLVTGVLLGGFVVGLIWLDGQSLHPGNGQTHETAREQPPSVAPRAEQTVRPKPRFEFYDMLPEMEVVIPEEDPGNIPAEQTAEISAPTASVTANYLLQIGSFRRSADADRLKAQLALLGIEAKVVKARIGAQETRYRVRSGPYRGEARLNKMRRRLTENGLNGMVIRLDTE